MFLTHAIEAYVSTLNSPFTDPLVLKAISMVFEYLPDLYNGNMAAREQMHYASSAWPVWPSPTLCWASFIRWAPHKTEPLTALDIFRNGCANAIYLPYVIQYNAKDATAKKRYAAIAKSVGLAWHTRRAGCRFVRQDRRLRVKLNILKTLKDFGINEAEFLEKPPEVAANAVGDACTGSNPRSITPAQMEQLLKATYYGTKVDLTFYL